MVASTAGNSATYFMWHPQVEGRAARGDGRLLTDALRRYCLLHGISPGDGIFAASPLLSAARGAFNLPRLSEELARRRSPIYLCGSLPREEMVERSWEELGLDIFDLPWFAPPERKAFRYINHLRLAAHMKDLQDLAAPNSDEALRGACEEAHAQLQWGRCHVFSTRLQMAVGHGARDHLQNEKWEDLGDRLRDCLSRGESDGEPCNDACGVRRQAQALLEKTDGLDRQQRLGRLQQIASLDCREYRLAQGACFKPPAEAGGPSFERIIVLENNPDFRKSLVESLRRYCSPTGLVIEADVKKSWEHYRLYGQGDAAEGDLIHLLVNNEAVNYSQILACFDLNLGADNRPEGTPEWFADVFGGFWVMYGTANAYQRVPRMVVTGFRSQDLTGLAAGGGAYLLKPFTDESLAEQVRKAAVLRRVSWLCPPEVRLDYRVAGAPCFERAAHWLRAWLARQRVELETIDAVSAEGVVGRDLVIVDLLRQAHGAGDGGWEPALDPLAAVSAIRAVNPAVPILLVVPTADVSQDNLSQYYRRLPLVLRDGVDVVIKKPMWVVADGRSSPDDALGNKIIERLFAGDFDIKYQLLVPVTAFVRQFDKGFLQRAASAQPDDGADPFERYAPLLPHLTDFFGLASRLSDLSEAGEDVKRAFGERLTAELFGAAASKEGARVHPQIALVLDQFWQSLSSGRFRRHFSLESWLRGLVDDEVAKTLGSPTIHRLTEPLTRVFGGSTRYEFGVRGSWYKTATTRVDDMLMTVEFCAQSSIIARQFIEATVVNYLRKIAGEAFVLVQEIPIRGYLK